MGDDILREEFVNPWQNGNPGEAASADLEHDVATAANLRSDSEPESTQRGSESATNDRKSVCVKLLGLTTVFEPDNISSIAADIVFVHGLGGHPRDTFEYKGDDQEQDLVTKSYALWKRIPLGTKKEPPIARNAEDRKNSVYWPSDLLPDDRKDARILTYGYDSHVSHYFTGAADQSSIDQHGRSLLNALLAVRTDCTSRPLVFVAHSLGGLVVEEALIESRKQGKYEDSKNLCRSCVAVMFFGTPHRGSPDASWAQMLSNVARVLQFDTNCAILQDLSSRTSKLESLRRDFLDCIIQENIVVHTFQESKGKKGFALAGKKVVPDISSSLDSREYETIDTISQNHMDMCRFSGREDDGYQRFIAGLANIFKKIKNEQRAKSGKKRDELTALLKSLHYHDRLLHQGLVLDPDPASVRWVWNGNTSNGTMSFDNWLSGNGAIFCIEGKPGSGKSTLMNYISRSQRTSKSLQAAEAVPWVVTRHFFHSSAGKAISNSIEGLLRSLLYEWVKRDDTVVPHVTRIGKDRSIRSDQVVWAEPGLREALKVVLEKSSVRMCIFVDGLDEYDGNLLDLLRLLQSFAVCESGPKPRMKTCIASCPDSIIVQAMRGSPVLRVQDHNLSGMEAYVSIMIQELVPLHARRLEEISRMIARKAKGVFLWARFAIKEIISRFAAGDDMDELNQCLEVLPLEMKHMYLRILDNLSPRFREEARLMFRFVCYARRPLKVQELITAVETVLQARTNHERSLNRTLREDLHKRINSRSGGLLEVIDSHGNQSREPGLVSLMHETVRPFLKQSGWLRPNGDGLTSQHSLWLDVCTRHIQAALEPKLTNTLDKGICLTEGHSQRSLEPCEHNETYQEITEECNEADSPRNGEVPNVFTILHHQGFWLIEYAVRYMFEHSRALEAEDAISSFCYIRNIMGARLCYLHQLMGHCWFCNCGTSEESYSILERLHLLHGMGSQFCDASEMLIERNLSWMTWGPLTVNPVRGSVVQDAYHLAVVHGLELCCRDALDAGQYLPSSKDISVIMKLRRWRQNPQENSGSNSKRTDAAYHKRTDAECAETKRMYRIGALLMNRGAAIGAPELIQCIMEDSEQMFKLLLSSFPPGPFRVYTKLEGQDCEVGPLWLLCFATRKEAYMSSAHILDFEKKLDLLLERGEDINDICGPAPTLLHAALSFTCGSGTVDEVLIRTLVDRRADINTRSLIGRPLLIAWRNARAAKRLLFQEDEWQRIVQLLVDRGAVIDGTEEKLAPRTKEKILACQTQSEDSLYCNSTYDSSSDLDTLEGAMLGCTKSPLNQRNKIQTSIHRYQNSLPFRGPSPLERWATDSDMPWCLTRIWECRSVHAPQSSVPIALSVMRLQGRA